MCFVSLETSLSRRVTNALRSGNSENTSCVCCQKATSFLEIPDAEILLLLTWLLLSGATKKKKQTQTFSDLSTV